MIKQSDTDCDPDSDADIKDDLAPGCHARDHSRLSRMADSFREAPQTAVVLRRKKTLALSIVFNLSLSSTVCQPAEPAAIQQQNQASQLPLSPDLMPYVHARSMINFSLRELIALMPELRNLEFTEDQRDLASMLQKVGDNVESFFKNFPNTTALERVDHEREEPGSRNEQYLQRRYHYVIAAGSDVNEVGFEEYRTSIRDELINPEELKGTYLMTSGHATSLIYFHSRHMKGCSFRYLGREKSGRRAHVIAFAQNPEIPQTTGSINLMGTQVTLLVQGAAWVDPDSYQILRMRLELLVPRTDVGLDRHTTKIELSEVRLSEANRTLWLPREVQVIISWRGWRLQNRHHYSQYRLFTVESQDGPKQIIHP